MMMNSTPHKFLPAVAIDIVPGSMAGLAKAHADDFATALNDGTPDVTRYLTGFCGSRGALAHRKVCEVDSTDAADLIRVKLARGIPERMRACHTVTFSGYAAGEHVRFETMRKLRSEHLDIDGIAVPGMSWGSAGMGDALYGTGERL